jgi:predicted dehydrogenase
MGDAHGLAVGATDGLELVAAVDPDPDRRKVAERSFPGIRTCADVADLLGDGDVDLVVVATPPSSHAPLALRLLGAGKHVVLEKPMCLTATDADVLVAEAAAAERVLTVHQNRRWDPDFLALRRAVDAGLVGDVFNVETFVGGFEHPCRAWHSEEAISGGAVYDWGSHHVDWILQLMGATPARVTTTAHKRVWRDVTNHDQLRLRMAWDDGREAEFLQSDIAAIRRPKFWVQGTAGTLAGHYRPVVSERLELGRGYVRDESHHAEAPVPLTLARYESGYGLTETVLPPAPEQRFAFHRNLADHLHLGEPLAVTPQSVRAVITVLEASHRAGRSGATVELEGAGAPVGP